jgi:23S rRNA (uridine2552-2'-O)-methyltransferase
MTKKPPGSTGHRQLHINVKTAGKRKSSSTKWLSRQLNDPFVAMAKKDGYRSRSAYKLIEIDDKFHILKPASIIIDLGAAPGGWSQVCVQRVKAGKIIGIDLQEMEPIAGVTLLHQDFMEEDALTALAKELGDKKANVVLSDMAAAACGHTQTDHIRILALCEAALDFAINNLQPGGSFATKILKGGAEHELLNLIKKHFKTVKHFKPNSSRKDSAEMFLVAIGFKG